MQGALFRCVRKGSVMRHIDTIVRVLNLNSPGDEQSIADKESQTQKSRAAESESESESESVVLLGVGVGVGVDKIYRLRPTPGKILFPTHKSLIPII